MGHVVNNRGVAHHGQFASQDSDDGYAPTPTAHAQGVALQDWAPSSKKLGGSGRRSSLRSLNVSREAGSPRTPTFTGSAPGHPESSVLPSWQSKVGHGGSPGPSRPSRHASLPANYQDQCNGESADGYGQAPNGYNVEDQWSSDDDEPGTGRESRGGNRTPTHRLHSSRSAKHDRGAARSPLRQTRSGGARSSSRGSELDTGHSDRHRGVDRLNYDSKVMSRRHLNYDSKAMGGEGDGGRADRMSPEYGRQAGHGDDAPRSHRERGVSRSNSGRNISSQQRARSRTPPRSPHSRATPSMFDTGPSGMGGVDSEGRRLDDIHLSAPGFLMASRTSLYDTKDSIFGSMYDIVIPPSPLDVQDAQFAAQEEEQEPVNNRFSCMPGLSPAAKKSSGKTKKNPLKWFVCGLSHAPNELPASNSADRLQTGATPEVNQATSMRERELYKRRHAVLRNRMEAVLGEQKKRKSFGLTRGKSDDHATRARQAVQGDLDTAFSVAPGSPYSASGTGRMVSIQRGQQGGARRP
ncbi:unnamed protein product [Ostreobium quekettii]|uniref:Uncharacterized protein n=1 Tax=Ostreobium quekettii TaxID=121088 RepID=A0A8S1IKK9_9CHLO|nr:unnamed protein product [Ostreobium quekettii]|eukprot:evm.model.scf_2123.2 EVM.evm.TU.scf_2123.2   scf_2123:16329-18648(+)